MIPIFLITIPDITKRPVDSEKRSFKKDFSEGFSFIKSNNSLFVLLSTFLMINLLTTPITVLLPIVVVNYFTTNITLGSTILSIALISSQIGSLLSSFFFMRFRIFNKNVIGVILGQLIIYISYFTFIISLFLDNILILYSSLFIFGFSAIITNIHSQTIWQSIVPPKLQGRVMSLRYTIGSLAIPISMLSAGILADLIGYIQFFLICSVIGVIFLLFVTFMTNLLKVEDNELSLQQGEIPMQPQPTS